MLLGSLKPNICCIYSGLQLWKYFRRTKVPLVDAPVKILCPLSADGLYRNPKVLLQHLSSIINWWQQTNSFSAVQNCSAELQCRTAVQNCRSNNDHDGIFFNGCWTSTTLFYSSTVNIVCQPLFLTGQPLFLTIQPLFLTIQPLFLTIQPLF